MNINDFMPVPEEMKDDYDRGKEYGEKMLVMSLTKLRDGSRFLSDDWLDGLMDGIHEGLMEFDRIFYPPLNNLTKD